MQMQMYYRVQTRSYENGFSAVNESRIIGITCRIVKEISYKYNELLFMVLYTLHTHTDCLSQSTRISLRCWCGAPKYNSDTTFTSMSHLLMTTVSETLIWSMKESVVRLLQNLFIFVFISNCVNTFSTYLDKNERWTMTFFVLVVRNRNKTIMPIPYKLFFN